MQDCIKNTSFSIRDKGAKIKYFVFITSLKNEDCNNALVRIYDKMNMVKLFNLMDEIDIISDVRKKFCKKLIEGKYKEILIVAF